MPDKDKYLGESDWDDIDLLTTVEATERLDDDIEALRTQLADQPGHPDHAAVRARLDRLVAARERLGQRRTFNFPKA